MLCLFSVLAAAVGLFAESAHQPWDHDGLDGDPKAVLQSAQAIPNPKGSDVTVLLEGRRISIDDQGRVTEARKLVYRVNTAAGVENWGGTSAVWEPWHQDRPEIRARVIASDGTVYTLDPKNMTDAPVDDDSRETYSDDRRYQGPLPGVTIGSVVEEEIVIRDTAPYFEGGISERRYYGRTVPVQQSRLVLETPASMPLHYSLHLLPTAKVNKEESADKVVVTVEIGPMEAVRNEDSNLPTDISTWPHIDFSTGKSWKDVSQTYLSALESQIRVADLKNALPTLAKGATRQDIIRAVVAKLHKDVRYTGVEFGRSKLVPQTTTEILKRKFGDCKDKATLLVAMLRAEGIDAHVALLVADPTEQDIEADMPGIGTFDHAIVVVPGTPDLWIDATAEYTPVGTLPGADQGRAALVVAANTEGLTRTPEAKSVDNVSVETREFFLAEMGPGRVVETTEPAGDLAAVLRRQYSGKLSDENRKELEGYMQSAYLAEKLTSVEAGNGLDVSQPYHLRLESAKATRGNSDDQVAIVAIPDANIFSRLPSALRNEQEEDKNDKKAEQGREITTPRTADFVLPEAFAQEWRYKAVPPPGFQIHGVPENRVLQIGPAKLTEEFKKNSDQTVTALLRFDTVKKRFTAEEAKQIRTAILKVQSSPMLTISFDQSGYVLLRAGKIRESLAAYRSLAALHPNEGLHKAQLANALLEAGLGEYARREASEAAKLEPASAYAYKTLGWVLQHDLIGRQFERVFDREGAVAAYRKAKELDPKDVTVRAGLAILLEYDKDGERYTPAASLNEAVGEYREIRAKDKDNHAYDDNLAFALLYSGQFQQARDFVMEIGATSATRRAIVIAATAAERGAEVALQRSAELSSGENERNPAVYTAGQQLMYMRRYPLAVEMMQEGIAGQSNSQQLLGLIEALRQTKRAEELAVPDDPAQAVVREFMVKLFTNAAPEQFLSLLSKSALNDGKSEAEHLKELARQPRSVRASLKGRGLPYQVLADVTLSNMRLSSENSDAGLSRVTLQAIGAKTQHFFVVKEDGHYKLLGGSGKDIAEAGREVLERTGQGQLEVAKTLLDWAREDVSMGGGDDPLSGWLFPRFWAKGQTADRAAMELAAAAIMVDGKEPATRAVAILKQCQTKAANDGERTKCDLALAREYDKEEKWPELREVAESLVKAQPQSEHAFNLSMNALRGQRDWAAADKAVQDRLARIPNDMAAFRSIARIAEMQNENQKARATLKPLIDAGRASTNDMNNYAWNALFLKEVNQEDVQIAQRALSTDNNNGFIMHTLACLLATTGRVREARDLLLQTMKIESIDEPDDAIWLGLGLLAEQYGEREASRAAYGRVEKPKFEYPTSNYALMQLRMKSMDAAVGKAGPTTGK